jgi:hypothetical protein
MVPFIETLSKKGIKKNGVNLRKKMEFIPGPKMENVLT